MASLKYTLMRSNCRSESPWYVPVGSMPCSSLITCIVSFGCTVEKIKISQLTLPQVTASRRSALITSQNFAPIWLPHWPPWMETISRMLLVDTFGAGHTAGWGGDSRRRPRAALHGERGGHAREERRAARRGGGGRGVVPRLGAWDGARLDREERMILHRWNGLQAREAKKVLCASGAEACWRAKMVFSEALR